MNFKDLVEAKESDFALGRDVESPFVGQQRAREVQLENNQGEVQPKIKYLSQICILWSLRALSNVTNMMW